MCMDLQWVDLMDVSKRVAEELGSARSIDDDRTILTSD